MMNESASVNKLAYTFHVSFQFTLLWHVRTLHTPNHCFSKQANRQWLWTCRYTGSGKHNTGKFGFVYPLQVRRVTCSRFFSNRRHKHKDGSWCKLQGEPWQVPWTVLSHQHTLCFQLWLRSDHIHMSAWIWTLPPDKTFIYVIYLCHIIIVGLVDDKHFDYGLDFKGNIHSIYLFLYLYLHIY